MPNEGLICKSCTQTIGKGPHICTGMWTGADALLPQLQSVADSLDRAGHHLAAQAVRTARFSIRLTDIPEFDQEIWAAIVQAMPPRLPIESYARAYHSRIRAKYGTNNLAPGPIPDNVIDDITSAVSYTDSLFVEPAERRRLIRAEIKRRGLSVTREQAQ